MGFMTDAHHQLNQARASLGLTVVMDWSDIDAQAIAMNQRTHSHDALSTPALRAFERDPDMRMLGRRALEVYRQNDPLIVDYEGSPYDADDPARFNGRFALLACNPVGLIPLDNKHSWRWAAEQWLKSETRCDSGISINCTAAGDVKQDKFYSATKLRRVVIGDFDVLFKCCKHCVGWILDPNRERLRRWNLGRPDETAYSERTYRNPREDDPWSDDFDPWS